MRRKRERLERMHEGSRMDDEDAMLMKKGLNANL